jgi:hypothetical protein
LLPALYRTHIPSSHQFSLGLFQPGLSEAIQLVVRDEHTGLQFQTYIRGQEEQTDQASHTEVLKECAERNIKRFAHCSDKAKVHAFVESNFAIDWPTGLGLPVSVPRLIFEGIVARRAT